MGIIAGEGSGAEPYFMSSISGKSMMSKYKSKTTLTENVLSTETCKIMESMMRNNVESIYGAERFPDLNVCAKSGTAEVGGDNKPHATFAGFIKDSNYPLAFIVIVENAGAGSELAATVAGNVLDACVLSMQEK